MVNRILGIYCRNGYFRFKPNHGLDETCNCVKNRLSGYGPLGSELRRNFICEWWYSTVTFGDGIHPIQISELAGSSSLSETVPKLLSLAQNEGYHTPYGIALRSETNFRQDSDLSSVKEYRQLYYFCSSDETEKWSVYWKRRRLKWWKQYSRSPERFVFEECKLNNYNKACETHNKIEYIYHDDSRELLEDFVIMQLQGDPILHCIVSSVRVDAALLTLVSDAYCKRQSNNGVTTPLLKLHLRLCPIRVAVLPKDSCEVQCRFSKNLSRELRMAGVSSRCYTDMDFESRLRHQDEIGTPFRAIVDKVTVTNGILQLQDRNSALMEPMESESLLMTILGMYQRFRDDN